MLPPSGSNSGLDTDPYKLPTRQIKLVVLSKLESPLDIAIDIHGLARAIRSPEQQTQSQRQKSIMAPAPRRDLLTKEHFAFVFGGVKTQSYHDPAAKGPGSHT
jgi:THO complex subunit 3